MPTSPRRNAGAFAGICGHDGDVTGTAQDREKITTVALPTLRQNRTPTPLDGASAQARIDSRARNMQDGPQNHLIYLSYGVGPATQETLYSILTLGRFPAREFRGINVRVVTDQPDLFAAHGIEVL